MAAKRTSCCGWQFEIHFRAGLERAEGCAVQSLLRQVCVEVGRVDIERCEADAGDSEGVAFAEAVGNAGRFDGDAANAAAIGEADEGAGLLNDAGEHGLILRDQKIGGWGSTCVLCRGLRFNRRFCGDARSLDVRRSP